MKKNVLVNGKVVSVKADKVKGASSLTQERHAFTCNKLLQGIYNMTPVIDALYLRVNGNPDDLNLYAQVCKVKGTNSPNIRALMEYYGDFNNNSVVDLPVFSWDEDNKELVQSGVVTCNDNTKEKVYIESYSHNLIIFSQLEKDIRKVYKKSNISAEGIKRIKQELIDNVLNLGLVMKDNKVCLNTKDVNIEEDAKVLKPLIWTPSNGRNETIMMSPIEPEVSFSILNEVSGGVLENALSVKNNVGAAIKSSARLGILSAPAIEMTKSANEEFGYVIVLDELVGAYDYDNHNTAKLSDAGIKIDNNISDGAAQQSVEFIQAAFSQLGRKVRKEHALLYACQTRANVLFTKVFSEAKTQENMQFRLKRIIEKYGEDRVLRIAKGQDVSSLNLNSYKDIKAKYDVIIIGNEKCLGTIVDTNGAKLIKQASLNVLAKGDIQTYLLDIAKCGNTKTSAQMLSKFMSADLNRTIDVVNKIMLEELNNSVTELKEGELDPQKCSLSQFIFRYAEGGSLNTVALKSMINELLTFNESSIDNLRVNIKAYFQRALFDDSYFLTAGKINGLLGKNKWTNRLECYSLDVETKYQDEIAKIENDESLTEDEKDKAISMLLTGVAFKYPSTASNENAVVTYLTKKQIQKKIDTLLNNNVITKEEAKVLADDFLNTSYGVTKIGPDNTLKHKLAGMDTDYDGIAVVFEKELVQIIIDNNKDTDGLASIIIR